MGRCDLRPRDQGRCLMTRLPIAFSSLAAEGPCDLCESTPCLVTTTKGTYRSAFDAEACAVCLVRCDAPVSVVSAFTAFSTISHIAMVCSPSLTDRLCTAP